MDSEGSVLVTGGCGSVGSAVVGHLLDRHDSPDIVVFDNDERGLFELESSLGSHASTVEFELGNVRDRERLSEVIRDVDYVVHAAALKQVPQCEHQPYESVQTNIDGTRNVVKLAKRHGVESVLTVSTDKATNPSSVMGASKLLAERVTLTADRRAGPDDPSFRCVRLGNVLGSSGSVVPVFLQQVEDGGPVTLTDQRMTRFVISKAQAASFIVDHVITQPSGVTFIPKLRSLRIEDLAEVLVEEYTQHHPAVGEIRIVETGRRPGERLHELLLGPDELHRTALREETYVVYPPAIDDPRHSVPTDPDELPEDGVSSKRPPFLSHDEIRQLVDGCGLVDADPSPDDETIAVVNQDD